MIIPYYNFERTEAKYIVLIVSAFIKNVKFFITFSRDLLAELMTTLHDFCKLM